jgi:hypothetical protein
VISQEFLTLSGPIYTLAVVLVLRQQDPRFEFIVRVYRATSVIILDDGVQKYRMHSLYTALHGAMTQWTKSSSTATQLLHANDRSVPSFHPTSSCTSPSLLSSIKKQNAAT